MQTQKRGCENLCELDPLVGVYNSYIPIDLSEDSQDTADWTWKLPSCTYQNLVFKVILIDYALIRYAHERWK